MRHFKLVCAAMTIGADTACARSPLPNDSTGDAAADATIDCASQSADLPNDLACTGLYSSFATNTVAVDSLPYAPAVPLWSDGSGKSRWVWMPPGARIDRSDANEWVYPVGTKLWKEFSREGKRIETRYFHKLGDGTWVHTTYVWASDETAAVQTNEGASITLADGTTYAVPTADQCVACHGGRPEPVMGFEEVSLGTPGATGQTLSALAAADKLTPTPDHPLLTIGDDGTGLAAASLGWLHVNCGVSCHNRNAVSYANAMGMYLKLDVATLDGRSSVGFDALTTTRGVKVAAVEYAGKLRIAPGAPDSSLLLHLITTRAQFDQMPPLASALVDADATARVRDWIAAMAPTASTVSTTPRAPSD
ncbi:MAG: hypothetical protein ACHREM_24560 [Polyangiales bacterium]